jgi:hypothetical protein
VIYKINEEKYMTEKQRITRYDTFEATYGDGLRIQILWPVGYWPEGKQLLDDQLRTNLEKLTGQMPSLDEAKHGSTIIINLKDDYHAKHGFFASVFTLSNGAVQYRVEPINGTF